MTREHPKRLDRDPSTFLEEPNKKKKIVFLNFAVINIDFKFCSV
jgi:hypothetical protein